MPPDSWWGYDAGDAGGVVEPHPCQLVEHAGPGLAAAEGPVVAAAHLGERRADRLGRIQAGVGLLSDESDVSAPDRAEARSPGPDQLEVAQTHAAAEDAAAGGEDAQDRPGGHRLAAPRLPHHREGAAGAQLEGDVVHHRAGTNTIRREADREAAHREQAVAGPLRVVGSGARRGRHRGGGPLRSDAASAQPRAHPALVDQAGDPVAE